MHKKLKVQLMNVCKEDLHKHIFILNNRICRIDTRKDITDQKFTQIYGQQINVRRAAFYILNGRWPARSFLLPWE